jgi:V8-like Glu-specific endopeptidase
MVAALGELDPETGLVFVGCNATLVSETVLVTAGHCVTPGAAPPVELLRVNFSADASPDADGWLPVAAMHHHPEATFVRGSMEDVGVVVLPAGAAPDVPHATLPTAGRLSTLAAHGGMIGESLDLVGYGCDHFAANSGPGSFIGQPPPVRKFATAPFGGLTKTWLTLRMNGVATDEGGTCHGDSGSPAFLPGTLEVVAVTTGGGGFWCRENGYDYRLDTETARDFLADYVDLP